MQVGILMWNAKFHNGALALLGYHPHLHGQLACHQDANNHPQILELQMWPCWQTTADLLPVDATRRRVVCTGSGLATSHNELTRFSSNPRRVAAPRSNLRGTCRRAGATGDRDQRTPTRAFLFSRDRAAPTRR